MDKYVDVDFALCATDGKHYDSGKLQMQFYDSQYASKYIVCSLDSLTVCCIDSVYKHDLSNKVCQPQHTKVGM